MNMHRLEDAVLWLCLALFPIAGVLALVAGIRGMWTGRVDWFGGHRAWGQVLTCNLWGGVGSGLDL